MIKNYILPLLVICLGYAASAQLAGPTTVYTGVNNTYTYTGFVVFPTWQVSSNATIVNTSTTGTGYEATIRFNSGTTGWVTFKDKTIPLGTINTNIYCTGQPTPINASREEPGVVTLNSNIGTNGVNNKWYTALTGGSLLSTSQHYSPNISVTTPFYVASVNSSGCESNPRSEVTATITPKPVIQSSVAVLNMGTSATLSVSNNTYNTYSWKRNDVVIGTGSTVIVNQPGTYTVTVTKTGMTGSGTSNPFVLQRTIDAQAAKNMIIVNQIIQDGITAEGSIENLESGPRQRSISYIGGLGNTLQTLVSQMSPARKDIVQPVSYDVHGRQLNGYLPYISGTDDSKYRQYALDNSGYTGSEQYSFYQTTGQKIETDTKPYSTVVYEASPLSRVKSQTGPGADWYTNNKKNSLEYLLNRSTDAVRYWKVPSGSPTSSASYANYQLQVVITTDENGFKVKQYTDKLGRVVQKDVEKAAGAWMKTSYVYNDFGQLAFVISPEGVSKNNYSPDGPFLNQWAFQYKYDELGRLVEYRPPGGDWIYTVYDKLDRPVLKQDGNLRSTSSWAFIKYDQNGRAVLTGIKVIASSTRSSVQTSVNSQTYMFELAENSATGYTLNRTYPTVAESELLTVAYYDSYAFLAYTGWDAESHNFSFVQELGHTGYSTRVAGLPTGGKVRLVGIGTSTWLNAVQYYDQRYRPVQMLTENQLNGLDRSTVKYNNLKQAIETKSTHNGGETVAVTLNAEYDHAGRLLSTTHSIGQPVQWTNLANVQVNGNTITKINTNDWDGGAFSVNQIPADTDGWVEFTADNNTSYRMLGLSDQDVNAHYSTIDFAMYAYANGDLYVYESGTYIGYIGYYVPGDVLRVERKAGDILYKQNGQILRTTNANSTSVLHADASIATLGATVALAYMGWGTDVQLSKYEYNELGQLVDKKLHNTGSSDFVQSVDFRYTIRGWLRAINNSRLTSDGDNDETDDFFGMELIYNKNESGLGNTKLYNGGISAIKYKGPGGASGAEDQRSYKYTYDRANRLLTSTSQAHTGSGWTAEAGAQNENMTYDNNGNIKSLLRNQRKHQLSGTTPSYVSETIDNLTYTYTTSSGNRHTKIEDATGRAEGFKNGTSVTTEYTYNSDGSLTADLNKGVSSITYNKLGKPEIINFTDGRKIEYTYNAAGIKLTMKNYQGTTLQLTTQYVGGFVYENSSLKFFSSPEGRVVKNGNTFEYQYAIADHQGNTRVVFSSVTPAPEAPTATFEGDSNDQSGEFLVNANHVFNFPNGNHTPGGSYVIRMNQTYKIGPSKSIKVFPGDKVDIQVGEYHEASAGFGTSSTPLSTLISLVAGAFGGVSGGGGESGIIYNGVDAAINAFMPPGNQGSTRPAAYLNYILFDKNYKVLYMGWQLAPAATFTKQTLSFNPVDIEEEGYIFVYLSYDNDSNNWVYFDDLNVTHTKTNVLQYNEYYPFGLQTSKSWTRENVQGNNYLYNEGSELNSGNGWYETMFRGYDPALGRFMQVDPMAYLATSSTPYHYGHNNPALLNDPWGLFTWADVQLLWDNTPEDGFSSWSDGGTPQYYQSDGNGGYSEIGGPGSSYSGGSLRGYGEIGVLNGNVYFFKYQVTWGEMADESGNRERDTYVTVSTYLLQNIGTDPGLGFDHYGWFFLDGFIQPHLVGANSEFISGSGAATGFGLVNSGAAGMLNLHSTFSPGSFYTTAATERALMKEGAKFLKTTVGRGIGVVGAGITLIEGMFDSNGLTAGDVTKAVVSGAISLTPAALVYTIADVGTWAFTGVSVTDRIGAGVDFSNAESSKYIRK
jgi:RHS repeat-associated protein